MNLAIFQQLGKDQEQLGVDYGGPPVWDAMDDARACKIIVKIPTAPGWCAPVEDRHTGRVDLVDAMVTLEDAHSHPSSGISTSPAWSEPWRY